jgi:hypothetical protein
MKRKPSYFWATTQAASPALGPISWKGKKGIFPSYAEFLRAFFLRANERIASFCSDARLRSASRNSSSPIAFSVI